MWQESVENRLAGLDGKVGTLRSEMFSYFRTTWFAMGGLSVLFASVIIGSYLLLDAQMDRQNDRLIDQMKANTLQIEKQISGVSQKLESLTVPRESR